MLYIYEGYFRSNETFYTCHNFYNPKTKQIVTFALHVILIRLSVFYTLFVIFSEMKSIYL